MVLKTVRKVLDGWVVTNLAGFKKTLKGMASHAGY
jgi:hypothetical protein